MNQKAGPSTEKITNHVIRQNTAHSVERASEQSISLTSASPSSIEKRLKKIERAIEHEYRASQFEEMEPWWQDGRTSTTRSLLLACWDQDPDDDGQYVQYQWRWVNLACIFGPIVAQSWLMMIFAPISTILREAYETTDAVIDSNSTIFFIMNLLVNIPSVYLLESGDSHGEGMAMWFKIASILTILGQWGRYVIILMFPDSFWLTIIPAAIIAFGQSFFLNGISKLACIWFGDNQRALAIGILTFGLAIGSYLGFGLSQVWVIEDDKLDHDKIKDQMVDFMEFSSLLTTLLCGPALFLYEQKPQTYPSKSAKESAKNQKINKLRFLSESKKLLENGNFRSTLMIFTIINGLLNCQSALMTQLIEQFGFDSVDSSYMGAISVSIGLLSSLAFPLLIQQYKWYLKSMKIIATGVLLAEITLLIALLAQNLPLVFIAISLFGLFNLPAMTVVYTYATETTYPAPEALFGSILQVGSSLFAAGFSYISLYLKNQVGSTFVICIYIFLYAISFIQVFYLNEDLKRIDDHLIVKGKIVEIGPTELMADGNDSRISPNGVQDQYSNEQLLF